MPPAVTDKPMTELTRNNRYLQLKIVLTPEGAVLSMV
jgi:hypothetical protein